VERLVSKLVSEGFKIDTVVPDGKSHRFPSTQDDDGRNLAWYMAFRNFCVGTGEEYFVLVYADWSKSIRATEYCTLIQPKAADKATIKRNVKLANKVEVRDRNEMYNEVEKAIKMDLGQLLGNNENEPDEMRTIDPHAYVYALGFKEKEYFFTTSSNQQIVGISKFTDADMLGLMPISYWESLFPGGGASRVDWIEAKSNLMAQARERGIFQPRRVRGAGVWSDDSRIVVNMGDHLVVDGERVTLGEFKSRYFYTLGSNLSSLHERALSSSECDVLVDACSSFKWLKSDYSFLMAGALVVSRVCGALPIRPHVWLTGGASTGKTTLLEKLIQPILGDSSLYVQGATSEAGIRQSIKADAIPVVFDEFETTGQKSSENVAAVIELLRAAWSDSSAMIIKGSSGGNATAYQVRCSAIVSSIRTKLQNDADRSRFAILELEPHGNDPEHWKRLSGLLTQIDADYSERLFARTISMVPILLANYRKIKVALAARVSQRFGDQYGMLLAGYSILLQDEPLTDAQAEQIAAHVQLVDEKDEAKVADHEECLNHLLTKKIVVERDGSRYDYSVSEAIKDARGDALISNSLQRHGIRVGSKDVAIASRHTELENVVYKGTRWSQGWASSLSRIAGAEKNKSVWLAGANVKCVVIPGAVFFGSASPT
jgi:putative DNA primase/helicase